MDNQFVWQDEFNIGVDVIDKKPFILFIDDIYSNKIGRAHV